MAVLEEIATVSSKGQFTLPKPLRDALGVTKGARLVCSFNSDEGSVLQIRKQETVHSDPAIAAFLDLLEADIANGNIYAMPVALEQSMRAAATQDVDFDEVIEGDVAL